MCSIKNLCKFLLLFVLLAKFSEATPKKYDSQSDGSPSNHTDSVMSANNNNNVSAQNVTEYEKEKKNNMTAPCVHNCGEWRVIEKPEFLPFDINDRRRFYPDEPSLTHGRQYNSYYQYPTYHLTNYSQFTSDKSFVSSNTYPDNPWRRNFQKDKINDTYSDNASDRTQRLGYSTGIGGSYGGYGAGGAGVGQGYGYAGTGIGGYTPYKVDLGGVILGAIVGVGALIFIPKVLAAIHGGGYGGYGSYRNIDELGGVTDVMTKIDEFLSKNNVDSTACMQKAVCHYMKSSSKNLVNGNASQIDEMLLALTENSIIDYMIDGTAIKEAMVNGRGNQRDCDTIYTNCPLDRDGAMQLLRKALPFSRS